MFARSLPHRRRVAIPALALALVLSGCGASATTSVSTSLAATSSAGAASATVASTGSSTAVTSSASATPSTSASALTTSATSALTSSSASAVTSSSASALTSSSGASLTGSSSGAQTSAAAAVSGATAIAVRNDPKLGMILTDAANRTLYWYTKDTPGVSVCTGGCLAAWPILPATPAPTLPSGVPGTVGMITRADGTTQATYDNYPLYYYVKDTAPGDTTGQAVGKVWYVITPTAGPLTPPAS